MHKAKSGEVHVSALDAALIYRAIEVSDYELVGQGHLVQSNHGPTSGYRGVKTVRV